MSCNIYYPDDLLDEPEGPRFVVGHRDDTGNYVVVSTVPSGPAYLNKKHDELIRVDNIKLYIIGTVNHQIKGLFQFTIAEKFPRVRSGDNGVFVNLIIFKSPNSLHMEFYSLNSILIKQLKPNQFSDKLEYHLRSDHVISQRDKNFKDMLFVVNSIDYLRYKFSQSQGTQDAAPTETWVDLNVLTRPVVNILILVFQLISQLLNKEFLPGVRLTRVSNMLYQLDTRLSLMMRIPDQISMIKQKTASLKIKPSLPDYKASLAYIRLYNLIYVMVIDLILGNFMRNWIATHYDGIVTFLHFVAQKLLYKDLESLIRWLMDNPAGFKLNAELSNFIGELYIWALKFWYEQVMKKLVILDLHAVCNLVFQLSKVLGGTLILSSLCDIISFLQIHVLSFCLSMTRIYNWQLNALKSLFRLFYGKKYNILRNRIDSQSYDFDQLLLGIIIFTVLIYLLPTIAVFYLSFVILHLAFYFISFILQMVILFMNELPVFIILLSLKNPKRLSDGLSLKLEEATEDQVLIRMSSKSLSLFKLLSYYRQLANLNGDLVSFKSMAVNIISGDLINKVKYEQIYDNFKKNI